MLAVPTHEEDKSIPFNDPNSLRQCSVDLRHLLGLGWSAGVLWDTGLESVLELAGNGLEVTAASGTGGLAALGLLGPVVCGILVCARCRDSTCDRLGGVLVVRTSSDLGSWVTTGRASVLLNVEGTATCI